MDKFTKVRNIGKGNMGACALARNNDDGKYYVIKQVDLTRMNKKERQQSLNEARVLSSLRHPNVINYVDSFLAKKSDHLCIVMEFADGGDVSSRIKKNYGVNFRESQVLDWFIQLVLSLHYVHQRKILHRDVKTQNVFLTSDNVVKLGDFGIARTLSNTYDQAKTFVGTPYYLSPELILERPYDHRSDVWALGVVLYELLTLKHPFNASDMKGLMQRILKVQYDPIPMIYSTEVRNIVPRLLMKDPAQRMELADVLKLPVIQRRIMEWLNGDVVPQKYLDTLVKQNLLPAELIEKARLLQDRENCIRVTAPTNPSDARHHPQEVGSALSHGKAMASGQSSRLHHSTHAESEEDSENGDTRTGGTDPVLPPLTARNRYSPSTVASEEVKTAPPTAYATPSTALRGHHDRLSPSASPSVSAQRNPYVRPQAQSQERTEYPVRRVSRQGAALGNGGARQALPPPQRAPLYRYYKTPSSNVSVAPPLYGVRQHKSHPPTTPPLSSQANARATPLPPRLSSLDNFYQQLNYYQQHRPAVGAAGGISSGATSARHGVGAASGEPAPSHSARSTAAPPAHIPVTVLSSRKVTRKRTEVNPPPSHINPAGRSNQHGGRGLGNGGAGAYSATPSTSSELGAGAPDIKAMLQRAAQERAQRRLGGVA